MFHKQYVSFPTRLFGLMVHKQTFAIFAKIFAFFVDSALSQNWTHAAGTTLSSAEGVVVQLWFRLSAVRSSAEILGQQSVTPYIDYSFINFLIVNCWQQYLHWYNSFSKDQYLFYEKGLNHYKNCENLRKCDEI